MIRTLVVDDAGGYRMLVREALRRDGEFDVVAEAGDGEAAIEAARVHQPDLVLLDLSMPRMDGLEALPRIRRAAPQAVVLVLSGFGANLVADKVRRLGAAGYLEKGLGALELPRSVKEHYEAARGRPGPASAARAPVPHGA